MNIFVGIELSIIDLIFGFLFFLLNTTKQVVLYVDKNNIKIKKLQGVSRYDMLMCLKWAG